MLGVQVPSLVGELRSHMSPGQKNQNIKQKQYCNKFNKDFKNGAHKKRKQLLKSINTGKGVLLSKVDEVLKSINIGESVLLSKVGEVQSGWIVGHHWRMQRKRT